MIKKCVYCGKEYETYDKRHRGIGARSIRTKRPMTTITCSRDCSRARIYAEKLKGGLMFKNGRK